MSTQVPQVDFSMLQRIYAEFLEMPGLRLTCAQAQRLLGLDEETCGRVLEFLVDTKFLGPPVQGMYARLTDGAHKPSLPRMMKSDQVGGDALKEAV
jgi:hypothetical protein